MYVCVYIDTLRDQKENREKKRLGIKETLTYIYPMSP